MTTVTARRVYAIYRQGKLVFSKPDLAPSDGTEVLVTFVKESTEDDSPGSAALNALRGRGRGEGLVDKLLTARRLDRDREQHA